MKNDLVDKEKNIGNTNEDLETEQGESGEEEEPTCDCFLIDARTCATVLGLDVEVCPCACHKGDAI